MANWALLFLIATVIGVRLSQKHCNWLFLKFRRFTTAVSDLFLAAIVKYPTNQKAKSLVVSVKSGLFARLCIAGSPALYWSLVLAFGAVHHAAITNPLSYDAYLLFGTAIYIGLIYGVLLALDRIVSAIRLEPRGVELYFVKTSKLPERFRSFIRFFLLRPPQYVPSYGQQRGNAHQPTAITD